MPGPIFNFGEAQQHGAAFSAIQALSQTCNDVNWAQIVQSRLDLNDNLREGQQTDSSDSENETE